MMFEFPKLAFLILIIGAIWIAYRWMNGLARQSLQRRSAQPRKVLPAEDLVACRACGSYVAADARACARPDCPQAR